MKGFSLLLLAVVVQSCFLVRDHRRHTFSYTDENGVSRRVPIIVPKGFKRQSVTTDSTGLQEHVFHYDDDAILFFAYMPRGGDYLPIDTNYHIPQVQRQGGIFYKGTGIGEYWWREAQIRKLRVGYTKVPSDLEPLFDSAVNYTRVQ